MPEDEERLVTHPLLSQSHLENAQDPLVYGF